MRLCMKGCKRRIDREKDRYIITNIVVDVDRNRLIGDSYDLCRNKYYYLQLLHQ